LYLVGTVLKEEATSALAGFHAGPLSWSLEIEFESVGFGGDSTLENPEKNPQSKKRGNKKLNSHTYYIES